MRLNSSANSFIFGPKNWKMHPELCVQGLHGENFQNASELSSKQLRFLTKKSRRCVNFFRKPCKAENFQNESELFSKQLRFWMHKLWNCAQNFFYKAYRQRTSKMRLNVAGNALYLDANILKMRPELFFELAR